GIRDFHVTGVQTCALPIYITGVNVVNWPMGRVLMSFFASKYVQFITGIPIKDTTAGYKCYHRKVLEAIELDKIKFIGYAFQIEIDRKSVGREREEIVMAAE